MTVLLVVVFSSLQYRVLLHYVSKRPDHYD